MTRNQKGFGAVETILIVFIVSIIAMVGWYVFKQRSSQPPQDQPLSSSSTVTPPALEKVFGMLSGKIQDEFDYVKEHKTAKNEYAGRVPYAVEGFDYKVSPSSYDNHVIFWFDKAVQKDSAKTDAASQRVAQLLTDYGFQPGTNPATDPFNDVPYYTRSDATCLFNHDATHILFECVTPEQLKDLAKKVEPQVKAYKAAGHDPTDKLTSFSLERSGKGLHSHNYAILGLGNAMGFFYTTHDTDTWEFAHAGQSGFTCNMYDNNDDANASFANICE